MVTTLLGHSSRPLLALTLVLFIAPTLVKGEWNPAGAERFRMQGTGMTERYSQYEFVALSLVSRSHDEPCEVTATGDRYDQSDDCLAVADALATEEAKDLERLIVKSTMRRLARFLRANPDVSIDAFSISPPSYELVQRCCDCVPGENCSAETPYHVCGFPDADGTCPSGTIRAVCGYYEGEWACTSID